MSLVIRRDAVFSLRLTELPMPTGSRDPEVLLDWILDSMGLVRRRTEQSDEMGKRGAIHRIMMEALLDEPLRGWDSKDLGFHLGLSNTGIHMQMLKLKGCGLISTHVEGKRNRYVLRGGSMSSATSLVQAQAKAILSIRLSELASMVVDSETRMDIESENPTTPFSIRISEPGVVKEGIDQVSSLVFDLGLAGDVFRPDDTLARDLASELMQAHRPITLLTLSDRLSETRSRVNTVIERLSSAGIVERAPMSDRIPQDVFAALMRQFNARGREWLLSRGGLGRLDKSVTKILIDGTEKGDLDIEAVREALSPVPLDDQRVLLNTLGGRIPFGFRLAGADGKAVYSSVMRSAERTLRRLCTVAERLDETLVTD